MSARPLLLDLFCGAGGAAVGYWRAGFDVIGVDNAPQPRYPFPFIQADALAYLARTAAEGFAAVHASPPCQDHSTLTRFNRTHGTGHILGDTLAALAALGLPYVVENVATAVMSGPYRAMLCGSMFGATVDCRDGVTRTLRRHRMFVSNFPLAQPVCRHAGPVIGVYGTGGGGGRGYKGSIVDRRAVMGIDWTTIAELAQAVPPVYTEYVGRQLLAGMTYLEAAA